MVHPLVFSRLLASVLIASLSVCGQLLAQAAAAPNVEASNSPTLVDFSSEIRPVLAVHCFSCHGPDEHSRAAELRLDIRENAIDSSAIVPHDPSKSKLVERILSDDKDHLMPPPSSKKPLSEKQKELLRTWIEQGAKYSNHWAFIAPVKSAVPELQVQGWASNPIDHYVGKK